MTRPRVVLLRGHHTNLGEFRPLEALADRFDIACLVTGSTEAAVTGLGLPKVSVRARRDLLPRSRLADLLVRVPGDAYLGLERHLAGADIVHTAELGVWFSRQPALLKERLGFKLVVTVWETIPLRATYRAFRGRAYLEQTLPRVDLFLATTERARECLLLEGAPPERIDVCPPGIDTDRFRPGSVREPDLVVSPGRLVWQKGHQDVLRAVAALRNGLVPGTPPRLLVVGRGPEEQRLRRYAADLGIADLVEFESVPYERMPEVFARASRVVLASLATPLWEEQFGMVLVEAMASGAPVVASASGAIPEVVGASAVLVRPGDWMGIARALAGPPAPIEPERVAHYSAAAAAQRLASAYERVLASP